MKIIKSFLLLTVFLSTANLLKAQEIKAEVLKDNKAKTPPDDNASNKLSPAPQLKPMDGVAPKESPAAAQAPSPLKNDENKKKQEDPKVQVLTRDVNAATSKLTAEQLKTLNGTAQMPKNLAPAAATGAENNMPLNKPVISPAAQKQ